MCEHALLLCKKPLYSNPQKQGLLRGGKCLKTPELKILFLSLYYIICGVIALTRFGESTGYYGDHIQRVTHFALCHLGGEPGSSDCPSQDSLMHTKEVALTSLSYFLFGCLPVSSLIFAFTSSDLERVAVCCKRVVRPSGKTMVYLSASGGPMGDSQGMQSVS